MAAGNHTWMVLAFALETLETLGIRETLESLATLESLGALDFQ